MDGSRPRIYLTREPAWLDLGDLGDRAIALVAKGYSVPSGLDVVELEALLEAPGRWLDGGATLVVVGLSRLMTPGNRCRLGSVLHDPRPGLRRISVDQLLFVSEPWRLWWHFCTVGIEGVSAHGPWDYTDSYLAESRWKRALERCEPDPFGIEQVREAVRGTVRGIDPFRFDPIPSVEVVQTSEVAKSEYGVLKERLFTHEKTATAIIRKLAAFAQAAVPQRSIPAPAQLFRRPPERIIRTDLAVDTWLVGQLLDRIALTNAIADESTAW